MALFNDWSVGGIIFVYSFIRIWSLLVSRGLLNTILRSSTGKKARIYAQKATRIQRLYGTYIPLITSYRHKLSKYLTLNNIVCSNISAIIITLAVVSVIFTNGAKCILGYCSLFTLLFLCIPPIIISYIQTNWNGSHPHYWFDLEQEFIGTKAQTRKRLLLNEKHNSLILTPEEFRPNMQ